MARRVSLPAADELFGPRGKEKRGTGNSDQPAVRAVPDPEGSGGGASTRTRPSGRVKHDEKMTVYVTSAELIDLEKTRLALRAEQGLVVDRGRLVREAFSMVLEDFHEHGEDSALVRRLLED